MGEARGGLPSLHFTQNPIPPNPSFSHVTGWSSTWWAMSGLAVAVANALLRELGICDLPSFTSMVRHDTAGVLAALESDACRAAADAAAVEPAAASMAADAAMTLQLQLMRDELRTVEQELRSPATPPTIQRAAMAASWQRRSELPSLRAAAAADRKAAAAEKEAAACERAMAAAVRAGEDELSCSPPSFSSILISSVLEMSDIAVSVP